MNQLNKAFRELRKRGYFARRHWQCCQSCGWAAIPEGKEDKAVFMHEQDEDCLKDVGVAYIAWEGDGQEICDVLMRSGLTVQWDGTANQRIKAMVDKHSIYGVEAGY